MVMDGESNGTQGSQSADAQQQEQSGQQAAQRPQRQGQGANDGSSGGMGAGAYEAQLAERDSRIEELEAQIAEAAKSAEAADALREEIAALRRRGEDERIEFGLMLAGCRNVKAARAVLEDHGGDVDALKAAEPWMFADAPAKPVGKTGLPNAGAASDEGREIRRWRAIAGLDEKDD